LFLFFLFFFIFFILAKNLRFALHFLKKVALRANFRPLGGQRPAVASLGA